ncbi:MAG: hypothetical protein L0Y57_08555 [Beijerinckiaceae bacterium]|nr:hypothetical protein [Beijerinckiaceae bacterium]MCI0598123.1 hypothetical protein [Beijerinckiaceae bacterium]MCI0736288.1 hypothetical protein [Beijerinckiaceae bacterium]
MSRKASLACAGAITAAAAIAGIGPALSHVYVGNRFFPATLLEEDPGAIDELALPTFAYITNPDGSRQNDFSFEYAKTIAPGLAVSVGKTFTHLNNPRANGWQNLETGLKYVLFVNPEHEFIFSAGVEFEWGHTGHAAVGAEPFTEWGPQIFFGKGLGDLPPSLDPLRPFAVTGAFGVGFSTHPIDVIVEIEDNLPIVEIEKSPTVFHWGLSVQYSLPYMNANVMEVGGPEFLRHLIPLVEFSFLTPVANIPVGGHTTTGFVAPGILYASRYFQLAAEALIPINAASGKHVGVIAQLHFYLDDIFPDSIGRPIFAPPDYVSPSAAYYAAHPQ